MEGASELAQLAELLRVGAQTGRRIAMIRPCDPETIERLAAEAERMADELDDLVARLDRNLRQAGRTD